MKDRKLGEFEELVLLAVYHVGDSAYGVTIQAALEDLAERTVSIGAVYVALDRLERKGCLRSRMGEATPERGGRRKRLFAISRTGVRMLEHLRRIRERIWRRLDAKRPPREASR